MRKLNAVDLTKVKEYLRILENINWQLIDKFFSTFDLAKVLIRDAGRECFYKNAVRPVSRSVGTRMNCSWDKVSHGTYSNT